MGGSAAFSRWLPVADEGPTLGNVFSAASPLYPTHLYTGFLEEFRDLNQTPMLKGTIWGRAFQFRPSNEAFSSKFAAAGLCYFNGGEGSKKASGSEGVSKSNMKFPVTKLLRVTDGFIAANVLAYIADRYHTLTLLGSKDNYWIRKGQLWRLVTCSFLHSSPAHLLVNCLSLYPLGNSMEKISGTNRYLAVYFASAIAGSGLSYCFNKSRSVGASGAIFGLLGAYAVCVMRHRKYTDKKKVVNSATEFALTAALVLLVKRFDNRLLVTQIDYWSILGGFLGGAAASWLLGPAFKYASQTTADGKRIYVDKPPISHFVKIEGKRGTISKKP